MMQRPFKLVFELDVIVTTAIWKKGQLLLLEFTRICDMVIFQHWVISASTLALSLA